METQSQAVERRNAAAEDLLAMAKSLLRKKGNESLVLYDATIQEFNATLEAKAKMIDRIDKAVEREDAAEKAAKSATKPVKPVDPLTLLGEKYAASLKFFLKALSAYDRAVSQVANEKWPGDNFGALKMRKIEAGTVFHADGVAYADALRARISQIEAQFAHIDRIEGGLPWHDQKST